MSNGNIHPYYLDRKPLILADITNALELARPHFEHLLPDYPLDRLLPLVLAEVDKVLLNLPYAGGALGRMTPFFEQGAGFFALGRVLRSLGVPIEINGQLMRKTFLVKLATMSHKQRMALGREWMSEHNQANLRVDTLKSTKRVNPGDFVSQFVEAGNTEFGEPFDFGIDYLECGFCKLCKASGDEDLLPIMCSMDNEVYALRGIELYRTTTIAGGDDRCNFRFRSKPELNAD